MALRAKNSHALGAFIIASAFEELGVSAALHADDDWYAYASVSGPAAFEIELGVEARRWPYNTDCFARARRANGPVLGQHAGFYDLFVPVRRQDRVLGVLAIGPFAQTRATSFEIVERWRWLTGDVPHAGDPRFADYVGVTLSTLTLPGELFRQFRALSQCLAELMAARGDSGALYSRAAKLRERLRRARHAERMWETAEELTGPKAAHSFRSPALLEHLRNLGVEQAPTHALVGLLVDRSHSDNFVDALVRRDSVQREAVDLARELGVACGRVGSGGVALLCRATGSVARQRTELKQLSKRLLALARAHKFEIHVGVGGPGAGTLPESYEMAMRAAESALSQGASVLFAEHETPSGRQTLVQARRDLARVVETQPAQLVPLFDRVLEWTRLLHRGRTELMRVELVAAVERIVEGFAGVGALNPRDLRELQSELGRAAGDATTPKELADAYRLAVQDIELSAQRPAAARKARAVRRAISFIRTNLSDKLGLDRVARVAGYAPAHFSRLFKQSEGMTLQEYVRHRRLAHAQDLLHNTGLSSERIAQLSGLGKRHFYQAFKEAEGMTPLEYRNRIWWGGQNPRDQDDPRHRAPKRLKSKRGQIS